MVQPMRVMSSLDNSDLNVVPGLVTAIEDAGFDGITVPENAHNPFLPLAVAAVNTTRLTLVTGVAIAFPRSPMMTAGMAWDLHASSGGRFVLGLGSQVKPHIERRFSTPWSAPAPRMREYINSVRAIWNTWKTGERLAFEGDHYNFSLMTPNFSPPANELPVPAIKISAVGPAMLRLSGEACDGVALHGFCTRDYITNQILPRIEEGMARTGRRREHFEISGGGFVATGATDEEVAEAMEVVRSRVGFYGSTKAYWPVLAEHGLEELGEKLLYLSRNDGWDDMADLVDDDVVRLFAAVGRHDQLVDAITDRFGGLTDSVSIGADVPPDLVAELQTIASPFESYTTDNQPS